MGNFSMPGLDGFVSLVGALIVVCFIMTWVTGDYGHWLPVGAGILVSPWAAQIINKKR
jgi:hypothetical protein